MVQIASLLKNTRTTILFSERRFFRRTSGAIRSSPAAALSLSILFLSHSTLVFGFSRTFSTLIGRSQCPQDSSCFPGAASPASPFSALFSTTTSTQSTNMPEYVMTSTPVPSEHLPSWMKKERTRMLTSESVSAPRVKNAKSIIYWMQRDVRTVDNWALLFANHLAETHNLPLHVIYVLNPPAAIKVTSSRDNEEGDNSSIPTLETMGMTERHGHFLLGGLQAVHAELEKHSVPLHILKPLSHRLVPNTLETQIFEELSPAAVICDFSPIRHYRQWMEISAKDSLEKAGVPLWQVDAHNVVPVWFAAPKRQVGARTLRPKIHNVVQSFLQKFPKASGNAHLGDEAPKSLPSFDYKAYENFLEWDEDVPALPKRFVPGTEAAKIRFESFVTTGLAKFDKLRNDPNYSKICSNLSPWLNHGHISFQRCMMAIKKLNKYSQGSASYIEEGLIRRELSDNFLFYTPDDYDKLSGAAEWAQESLRLHTSDPREYLYTLEELENGQTHDDLWNAAQLQVVKEGGMHGFLRMYWAKKILEWTPSPAVALKTAQYFNDKYALDGRDPNGFVGVGWSVMGIHDMGWKERDIFGKIRFMNYAGCKRKFKVNDFVSKYPGAAENAAVAGAKDPSKITQQPNKKRKATSSPK